MDLSRVEHQLTGLQQYLTLMIMTLLGVMMLLSYNQPVGTAISALAVLCLAGCLYMLFKERKLRQLHQSLVGELLNKDRQVVSLGEKLEEGSHVLQEEQGKAAELEARLMEISGLYRAISRVDSEADDSRTVDVVLRAALELVGGSRGSIMLLDPAKAYLEVVGSVGFQSELLTGARQRVGTGVAGWVVQFGEPLLLSGDAREDDRFTDPNDLRAKVQSALCVPLTHRGETIGVMNLSTTDESKGFTDYQMRIATIFGQHASISIVYSRLRGGWDDDVVSEWTCDEDAIEPLAAVR
ncbi:MAG: GAF domain-containing protein [Chromatiaceae bacterium]|jgi:transcriptional regulator with GAF, ATPase, and Fis domain|nr:GAF domain-containing protein [Chromatiaceae bacterium]